MPYLAADKLFSIDCNRQWEVYQSDRHESESVSDLQEPLNHDRLIYHYCYGKYITKQKHGWHWFSLPFQNVCYSTSKQEKSFREL